MTIPSSILTVSACLCAALHAATITEADDVLFVVGEGANRATLVVDFNDGLTQESFAWGFRWEGSASGAAMMLGVAGADPNLTLTSFGDASAGFFISSIEYFDGVETHMATGGSFATYPDDYVSWSYYLSGGVAGDDTAGPGGTPTPVPGGGDSLPAAWNSSSVGASADSFGETGRLLTDGAWDAWSFGALDEGFIHQNPPGPEAPVAAAVPEPSALLAGLGALALLGLRRRR